jgi:hypothetical protein
MTADEFVDAMRRSGWSFLELFDGEIKTCTVNEPDWHCTHPTVAVAFTELGVRSLPFPGLGAVGAEALGMGKRTGVDVLSALLGGGFLKTDEQRRIRNRILKEVVYKDER